jgi:hypothetical protein
MAHFIHQHVKSVRGTFFLASQTTASNRFCSQSRKTQVALLLKVLSLGYFSLHQQRKVTRATARNTPSQSAQAVATPQGGPLAINVKVKAYRAPQTA